MTAHIALRALEGWLRAQRHFPPSCAAPFAALLEHYGKRLERPVHEAALRTALIKYLDLAEPLRDEIEPNEIVDGAELLLDDLERARGGRWPIDRADLHSEHPEATTEPLTSRDAVTPQLIDVGLLDEAEPDEIAEGAGPLLDGTVRAREEPGPHQVAIANLDNGEASKKSEHNRPAQRGVTTIQLEPGLGGHSGRALTERSVLLLLAVTIISTETDSEAAAIEVVLPVFAQLGLPPRGDGSGAPVTVSRTRKLLNGLLAEPRVTNTARATFTPAGVRAAYEHLAEALEPEALVCVPTDPQESS